MRSVNKGHEPQILTDNKLTWSAEYEADKGNKTKRYRYRHPEIKTALKRETAEKCVYCESKIGHNTPGDVEHKIPTSADSSLHFEWSNLTVACTECNRRKRDYFDVVKPFLDPYSAGIEARIVHHGPIVCWAPGDAVAENSVKILELHAGRTDLISRKAEAIDALNNVVERLSDPDPLIQDLMRLTIRKMRAPQSEYSGMMVSVCEKYGL